MVNVSVTNGVPNCIGAITSLTRERYLLDGYTAYNLPKAFQHNEKNYYLQHFQKEHENEFVIRNESEGYCYLYQNGLLKMMWKEEKGVRKGDFISLERGRISFIQSNDNFLNDCYWYRKVNDRRGCVWEIWNDGRIVYRGEVDDSHKRNGIGISYDTDKGIAYECIFKNDECIQILKIFEGDEMIELLNNGNNVDVSNQIPVYVGGYCVDDYGEYVRDGIGYLIDADKRIAYAEVFYENGTKVKEIGLFDGWYHQNRSNPIQIEDYPKPVSMSSMDVRIPNFTGLATWNARKRHLTVMNSSDLSGIHARVVNVVIPSNCCNDVSSLNWNNWIMLQSIKIGNGCFVNVDTFTIDGLHNLKSIRIGMNSFSKYGHIKNLSRSFHILNCATLESIEIGKYSFSDYAGEFELKDLPSLSSIKIGDIKSWSRNFMYSSFVVKDLPNLQSIQLGSDAFENSLSTVISNLPNLKSIQLGIWALEGRFDDSCSLEMKDLPQLQEIINSDDGCSFFCPRSVILSNIPNLKTVKLPDSFRKVKTKSIRNVSSLLASLVKIKS